MNDHTSTHKRINLSAIHRKVKPRAPLGEFFRSAACRAAVDYLKSTGLAEDEVIQRGRSWPGQPAEAAVHPLLVVEYLRWADYSVYAKRIGEVIT